MFRDFILNFKDEDLPEGGSVEDHRAFTDAVVAIIELRDQKKSFPNKESTFELLKSCPIPQHYAQLYLARSLFKKDHPDYVSTE
jgi:hypothetical protein